LTCVGRYSIFSTWKKMYESYIICINKLPLIVYIPSGIRSILHYIRFYGDEQSITQNRLENKNIGPATKTYLCWKIISWKMSMFFNGSYFRSQITDPPAADQKIDKLSTANIVFLIVIIEYLLLLLYLLWSKRYRNNRVN